MVYLPRAVWTQLYTNQRRSDKSAERIRKVSHMICVSLQARGRLRARACTCSLTKGAEALSSLGIQHSVRKAILDAIVARNALCGKSVTARSQIISATHERTRHVKSLPPVAGRELLVHTHILVRMASPTGARSHMRGHVHVTLLGLRLR